MNVTVFMTEFKICSYLRFPFFIYGCLLHLVNPAPLASIVLTVCCQRSEDQTVAEKKADSVPTGDIPSSQIQVLTMWKNTVVLWGGEDLVQRSKPVLFQASSSAGKIPRMQARHTSFFSGKGFGFIGATDCLVNTIIQSYFIGKMLSSIKCGKLQCFVDILKRTVTLSVLLTLSAVFLSSPTHTIQTHVIIKIGSLVLKNSAFLPF